MDVQGGTIKTIFHIVVSVKWVDDYVVILSDRESLSFLCLMKICEIFCTGNCRAMHFIGPPCSVVHVIMLC